MGVREKILIVYPITGDDYYYLGKRIKSILIDVGISKYDIDLIGVQKLEKFMCDVDSIYTMGFVPESIGFYNIAKEDIERIFPLIKDVSLNHLYYYNRAGHLYQFAGNIYNTGVISQAFKTLRELGVVNKEGHITHDFSNESMKGELNE